MNINKRESDLEKVFNQRWKANNFNQNGMKETLDQRKNHFNKMYNINQTREEHRKEILEANSVEGQVSRLEEKMKAAKPLNNNRFR